MSNEDDEFWGRRTPVKTIEIPRIIEHTERVHIGQRIGDPDWAWSLLWFGCGFVGAALLLFNLLVFGR